MESEKVQVDPKNPFGVGDPDDNRLSKVEQATLIRQIKSAIIKTEKCPDLIEEYYSCSAEIGPLMTHLKCKQQKLNLHDCIEYWDQNDEIWTRARKFYLAERRRYRQTGVSKPFEQILREAVETHQ